MSNIDKIDQKIIFFLQQDGKLTNFELAEKVGLSPSPCLRRVKTLEQKGLSDTNKQMLDAATKNILQPEQPVSSTTIAIDVEPDQRK